MVRMGSGSPSSRKNRGGIRPPWGAGEQKDGYGTDGGNRSLRFVAGPPDGIPGGSGAGPCPLRARPGFAGRARADQSGSGGDPAVESPPGDRAACPHAGSRPDGLSDPGGWPGGPDAHPARGHRPLRGPPRLLGAVRAHSPGGPGAPAEPLSGARMGLHTGRGRRGGSIYGGCGAGLVQRSLRAAGPSVSGPAGGVADAAGGAPSARRAPPGAPPTLPHRRAPRRGGPRADRNP